MAIYEFILANWDSIVLVVALIVAIVYLIYRGEKGIVFKMLYSFVTEAEKAYGGGTGTLKLASVIAEIYPKLPRLIKLLITADTLEKWVETVLAEAKKTWEKNTNLAAYIEKSTE